MVRSGRQAIWCGAAALVLACGERDRDAPGAPAANEPRSWEGTAAESGVVAGLIADVETGEPIPDVDVELSTGHRTRTRADGTFEVTAPAGRVRVSVRSERFVNASREVAVGAQRVEMAMRVARKAAAQRVDGQGATVTASAAALEVPAGAFPDGAEVSVTYLSRARVAAAPASAQFVDNDVPRRVVATVAVETSEAPAMPMRMRVPVPEDADTTSVAAFVVDGAGRWRNPVAPESVSEGVATFAVKEAGSYGVTVDTRFADDRQIGYVVLDSGDSPMLGGQVLEGGSAVTTASRAVTVVDPRGSTVEIAPASRARLEPPAEAQFAPDAGVASRANAQVAYAGRVNAEAGRVRVVVARPTPGEAEATRLTVRARGSLFEARGTAFTVTTCEGGGRAVDSIEVVEGTVTTSHGTEVVAGRAATFCTGCPAGAPPVCGQDSDAAPDALRPDVASVPDAAAVIPDASAAAEAAAPDGDPPVPDAGEAGARPDVASGDAAAPRGVPAIIVAPTSHDFGAVLVGAQSPPVAATLTNTGIGDTGPLSLSLVPPAEVTIVENGCTGSLAPGATCQVQIAFSPTTPGPLSARLQIGASEGATAAVDLRGSGATAASLVASPASSDFGTVVRGEQATATVTVRNGGGVSTGPLSLSLVGPDAAEFAIVDNGCLTPLAPSTSCAVTVRLSPASDGAKSASLLASALPGGSAMAALAGRGAAPAGLVFAPAAVALESTVGKASATARVTLTNEGGIASGPPSLQLEGADAAEFRIVAHGCTGPLPPQGSCPVDLELSPATPGTKTARIAASASPGGTASAALSGAARAPAALVASPGLHDFGGIPAATVSDAVTIEITNDGDVASGALAVSLQGADAVAFALAADGCSGNSLEARASCTIQVRFAPASSGGHAASLAVSAAPGGAVSVALVGSGLTPATLAIAPGSHGFGDVIVGAASPDVSVSVTNKGAVGSGVTAVNLTGSAAGEFVVVANGCVTSLPPGSSCVVTLRFTPTSPGAKAATLAVAATPGGQVTASLSGNGMTPPALTLTPAAQSFGSVDVGKTASGVAFTVTNTGGAPAGTPALTLTGTDAAQFLIVGNGCTGPLAPAASCTATVSFAPNSAGAKSASLVASALPGGSATASLSGTGTVPPALSVSPGSFDFGGLETGTTTSAAFTLVNNGGVAGAVALTLSGPQAAHFAIGSNGCSAGVPAASSCTFHVTFAPTARGALSAAVTATASGSGTASATLGGTGLAPAVLSLAPSPQDFGSIPVGATTDRAFTVTNTGDLPSSVPSLSTTDPQFTIVANGCAAPVAVGASCPFQVRFAPATAGAHGATLTVSGTPGGSSSAALTGQGLTAAQLTMSLAAHDFGSVATATQSAEATFTVTNTGAVSSGPTTISLTGTDAAHFVVTFNGCANALAAGASCLVKARFAPTTLGTKGAALTASASPGGGAGSSLSGVGVAPAALLLTPSSHDYGIVAVGGSALHTFTLTNVGGAASGAASVGTSGANPAEFTIVSHSCGSPLPPGASCTMDVRFQPAGSGGSRTASLNVMASPGGAAGASLLGTAGTAQLTTATTFHHYGSMALGSSATDLVVVITNAGNSPSATPVPSLSGTNAPDYAIVGNTCSAALAAGMSCNLTVRFTPSQTGPRYATLTVAASPGGSTTTTLEGTGYDPTTLSITPSSFDWGTQTQGTMSSPSYFTITNAAGAPATGTLNAALTGPNAGEFTIQTNTCAGTSLAPGGSCVVGVVFTPASAGAKSATLTVSGSPGGAASAALAGTGS